ncbi:MAG: branched-chain amino acid ABC transporter permease [Candidatus Bipolaricaulia bacterium]
MTVKQLNPVKWTIWVRDLIEQRDLIKWAIWGVLVSLLIWGLFFNPAGNGPQFILDGIRFGSILMLGAIGLSLTYKILNFANFSHGDILLFGAYVAFSIDWFLVGRLPNWFPALADPAHGELLRWLAISLAIVIGVIATIIMANLIDYVIYRRMRRSAAVVLVIASFGMALFLRSFVQAIWGVGNRAYAMRVRLPMFFDLGPYRLRITTLQIVTIVVAFVLVTLLHLFLRYTRTGKAMRAMSDNMDLARVTGINTDRMIRWTWGIGAGLAAIAGVFMGLNFGVITPNTGAQVLLPLFAAVILGGIGSPYGAMLGAMVIGIAQTVLVFPVTGIPVSYKPGIAFLLMIIMLLVRPNGLLGEVGRRG